MYCPSCGKLVDNDASTCPTCGMWLAGKERLVPHPANQTDDRPQTLARMNSSLPSKEEVLRAQKESNTINTKFIVVATIACVVLICGAILLISHPWDPNAFSTRANAPADLSQDGFPGEINALSGQDSASADGSVDNSANNELYTTLTTLYRQIADAKTKAEKLVLDLDNVMSLSASERENDYKAATELTNSVSTLTTKTNNVSVEGTSYSSSKASMQKAEESLRELSDNLLSAWKIVHVTEDLNADKAQLDKLFQNQIKPAQNAFAKVFKAIEVPKPA